MPWRYSCWEYVEVGPVARSLHQSRSPFTNKLCLKRVLWILLETPVYHHDFLPTPSIAVYEYIHGYSSLPESFEYQQDVTVHHRESWIMCQSLFVWVIRRNCGKEMVAANELALGHRGSDYGPEPVPGRLVTHHNGLVWLYKCRFRLAIQTIHTNL